MNRIKLCLILHATLTAAAAAQDKPLVDPPELVARREDHLRDLATVRS